MVSTRSKVVTTAIVVAVLGGVVYGAVAIARHGFSAREKPSRLEEWLARHARKIATPSDAKQLRNPHPATAEGLAAARAHWADHCASCHALDGSGNTALGRNLYPKAPDMRDRITQNLSDGELYDIITNGVRFTGMPAWGGEHTPQETWQLVAFIRRLPTLSADELKQMKAQSAKNEAHTHEHKPGAPTHAH